MTWQLTLYTRGDCRLCEEMKEVVRKVAGEVPSEIEEVDVDSSSYLREKYGNEVPLLFINGRKAFKIRVTVKELRKRLRKGTGRGS